LGDRDNATMALDVELKWIRNTKIYGELFIDDISTAKLGTGFYGNKYAYQLGFLLVDVATIGNLDLRFEYARIRPFTYSHKENELSYVHYSTNLGYRYEPNSDNFFVQLLYHPLRRLFLNINFEKHRHGNNPDETNVGGSINKPHRPGDPFEISFLAGELTTFQSIAFGCTYEFIRDGFIVLNYTSISSDRNSINKIQRNQFDVQLRFNY
jgi:hypothetical protein